VYCLAMRRSAARTVVLLGLLLDDALFQAAFPAAGLRLLIVDQVLLLLAIHRLDLVNLRVLYIALNADRFGILPGVLGQLLLVGQSSVQEFRYLCRRRLLFFEQRDDEKSDEDHMGPHGRPQEQPNRFSADNRCN